MSHVWKFFRTGGLDQVLLETGDDLVSLDQLDQELWVALSCPVKGLELDEKTLALVDADGPDVIAAIKWAAARLADAGILLKGEDGLPIAAIRTGTPAGDTVAASARQILASLGRRDAASITVDEAADTAKIFSATPLNGDGILPPEASEDPAVQALVRDIIACCGGATRPSGVAGVAVAAIDAFFAELEAYVAWMDRGASGDIAVLGEGTEAAFDAVRAVRAKVDDYFARCRLAAFDPRSAGALNPSEAAFAAAGSRDLSASSESARAFPLARVEAGRPLPLALEVNPAWAAELDALRSKAVAPLIGGDRTSLAAADWEKLTGRLAAYEAWLSGRQGAVVEKLGAARAREILGGGGRAALAALAARDRELEPHFKSIGDVERLARYHRDST